jgi:preprotein translocase subunit SecG
VDAFIWVVLFLHVVLSFAMIGFILMHRGTGGGLSDMFGGGSMGHLQGSAIVEKNLTRITVFIAVAFGVTTILLGLRL